MVIRKKHQEIIADLASDANEAANDLLEGCAVLETSAYKEEKEDASEEICQQLGELAAIGARAKALQAELEAEA